MPTADAPPPGRRAALVALRVAAIVVLAAAAAAAHAWYGNRNHLYDLRIYASAMRWWADGYALYDFSVPDLTQGHLGFTYPPFAAVVLRPLAWLSHGGVAVAYLTATGVALVLVAYWLTTDLADRLRQPRWFVTALAVVLLSGLEPIRATVDFGQINLILMALVVGDVLVLGRRRSRFAGVGVGLAAAIKLIPAVFIAYALVTRRWRMAAVATGTAVGATLLAAAFAPGDSWQFWTVTLRNAAGIGDLAYFSNQSVLGLLTRAVAGGGSAAAVWLALALPILGYGLWRATRAAQAGDEITGLALVGLAGGLVSPVTWHHHLVWLAPALVSLVTAALAATLPARRSALLAASALAYVFLVLSPLSFYEDVLGHPGGIVRPLLVNWYVWLALALVAALPVTATRRPGAATEAAAAPARLTEDPAAPRPAGPGRPAGTNLSGRRPLVSPDPATALHQAD